MLGVLKLRRAGRRCSGQRQCAHAHSAQRPMDGQPYDGRVFSAWMLGCSLFVGNAAYLLLVWTFVIPPAWLGIVVSLCIYRTRRRVLLGIAGGALMLWPLALQSI